MKAETSLFWKFFGWIIFGAIVLSLFAWAIWLFSMVINFLAVKGLGLSNEKIVQYSCLAISAIIVISSFFLSLKNKKTEKES